MTCQRYWRDGIVLVERGERDAHRDTCADCRREHAARDELVRAIPMVGWVPDDSNWQARVWRQIAREDARPSWMAKLRRWWWSLGGVLAAACALIALWRANAPDPPGDRAALDGMLLPADNELPRVEIISGPVAMRSTAARVGDRVRISARAGDDVRVYRAEQLVMRCTAAKPSAGCVRTARGIVAETALATAGEYQLVMIRSVAAEPQGALSADIAAVARAGGDYEIRELSIR